MLLDDITQEVYSSKFLFHVIELKKLEEASEEEKCQDLYRWARLIATKSWEEVCMEAKGTPYMETAKDEMEKINKCRRTAAIGVMAAVLLLYFGTLREGEKRYTLSAIFFVIFRNSSISSVLLQCSGDTRIAPSIPRASTILLEYMLLLKRSNTVTP